MIDIIPHLQNGLIGKTAISMTERITLRTGLLLGAGFIAVQVITLLAMGLPAICTCGYVALWHGNPSSPETSQHLTDWYTYTHVIHGFGIYLLLWLIAPRISFGLRLAIAIGLGAAWEVAENTSSIIGRFRESAFARGDFGDSVINSVFDTLATTFGFVLAHQLPVWSIVTLAIAMELFVGFMIHDSLTLNILQLIYRN